MDIVGLRLIQGFARRHPKSRRPLQNWVNVAQNAQWSSLVDVRRDFNSVDYRSGLYIFNIHGNDYRLLSNIIFIAKTVTIVEVLTHAEYDRFRL